MSKISNKGGGRSRWLRRVALASLILLAMAAALATALYFYLDSDQFREQTRRLLEETLSRQMGAEVSLERFEWDFRQRRFHLENLILRGSEPRDGPPLAHIERIEAAVSLRDLIDRRAHFSELIIERPHIFLIVDEGGKTNIPALASRSPDLKVDYSISIDEFKIIGGAATINARPIAIEFAITKLNSAVRYRGNTGVLSGQLRFDGGMKVEGYPSIPYTISSGFDYTAGSVLAHDVNLKSGDSTVKAQGRIDRALTPEFNGQLEYTAVADSRLLNHFFEKEQIEGIADVRGKVTFSRGALSTSGSVSTSRMSVNGWTATALRAQFSYGYPDGRFLVNQLSAETGGGVVEGSLSAGESPAHSRVTVDLRYRNIDMAAFARVSPWDRRYRVYSKLDGGIKGWFEGRFETYQLTGNSKLTAYTPKAIPETVALPIDGQVGFTIRPGSATITNGQARFFSTAVEGDGVIGSTWNMKVKLTSSDLRNLFFIYRDANGSGSISGTITGPINTPMVAVDFEVVGHKTKERAIERVAGAVRIDTAAGMAELINVNVSEGASTLTLNGKVALNGESVDVRVETARLAAEDAGKFDSRLAERLGGIFSFRGRLTSLAPIRAEGDIEARDLIVDKLPLGAARAHVRFHEPVVEITNLNVRRGAAIATGIASYDTRAETVRFDLGLQSIDLELIRDFGVPSGVTGVVERGHFSGSGPLKWPSIEGADVVFRDNQGGVVTGGFAYDAADETLRVDLNVTSLALDGLKDAWTGLKMPASLTGAVVERGRFSGSGTISAFSATGKGVSIRESHGATLTGDMAYNIGTDRVSFDVNVSALKLDVVRDIARDLGHRLSVSDDALEGLIVERAHFVGNGTARQPSITGSNITIRDGRGAAVTAELAYDATADTLTFDVDVASLNLVILRDIRPELNLPAERLKEIVIERGHFAGRGAASRPIVTGRNVTIRESHGAVLTLELAYSVGLEKLSFDMSVAALDLNSIRDIGIPPGLTGTMESGRLHGDVIGKQPNIEGSATLRNLSVFGEAYPLVQITIPRSNGGRIPVMVDAGSVNLSVEIDLAGAGYPFTGSAQVPHYPADKLARLSGKTLRLTGRADRLEGLLTDWTTFRGSGRIESAEMLIQGRELKSTGPFTFEFTHDRATVSGISLTGGGTALNVEGTVSLTDKENIDLKVSGTVGLDLLTAGTEWPATGELELNARIGGTAQERDLSGIATFKNASVSPKGFLGTISNLNGEMFFSGNAVRFDHVTGSLGGGKVQVQGEAIVGKDQIDSMNMRVSVESVRIPYPEGLRTVIDGVLVLRGSSADPLLEGNLQIKNMSYQGRFESLFSLLETSRTVGSAESFASRLKVLIHIEGSRNITIKNEFAESQARVSLDIRGTIGAPSVTGHIEVMGGTLRFQGTQYEITRGNIDFVNPFMIEPVVDIQAEAALRNYRVILAITGRGDRIGFELRSDPALPELEVLSLATGGKTREELLASSPQAGAGVSSDVLFPCAAAALLTELVKERVGGTLGLQGLERFRIQPLPIGSEKNALARITVPVQVSSDLLITYSQDLSSSAQEILQIEYFVTKDISILATRDQNGALSLDVKRRQRF